MAPPALTPPALASWAAAPPSSRRSRRCSPCSPYSRYSPCSRSSRSSRCLGRKRGPRCRRCCPPERLRHRTRATRCAHALERYASLLAPLGARAATRLRAPRLEALLGGPSTPPLPPPTPGPRGNARRPCRPRKLPALETARRVDRGPPLARPPGDPHSSRAIGSGSMARLAIVSRVIVSRAMVSRAAHPACCEQGAAGIGSILRRSTATRPRCPAWCRRPCTTSRDRRPDNVHSSSLV